MKKIIEKSQVYFKKALFQNNSHLYVGMLCNYFILVRSRFTCADIKRFPRYVAN